MPLYYYLEEGMEGPLEIEISDSEGQRVRHYSSEESDFESCLLHNEDPRRPYEPKYPSVKTGLNKWNWDTRRQGFSCVRDITLFEGLQGPHVVPGDYTARISVGGKTSEAVFSLKSDPRITASAAEITEWSGRIDETTDLLENVLVSLQQLRKAQGQIRSLMGEFPEDSDLQQSGREALNVMEAWDHQIIQPLHETYEDEDAWETMLAGQIRYLLEVIDSTGAPVTDGAISRLADLKSDWATLESLLGEIRSNHIDPINAWARENSVPHINRE